jgi:hypothetical protein
MILGIRMHAPLFVTLHCAALMVEHLACAQPAVPSLDHPPIRWSSPLLRLKKGSQCLVARFMMFDPLSDRGYSVCSAIDLAPIEDCGQALSGQCQSHWKRAEPLGRE